jgi:uncharacterized protein (DUF488 family)
MTIVYTIGYEGTDIGRFVATLKAAGVKRIADVRAVPLSRKKGFSKKALSAQLMQAGIEYSHFVELGDPKPGRDAAKAGLYKEFRNIYSIHFESEAAQVSLKQLLEFAKQKPTCLMCFERDPTTCHRSIVAAEMAESVGFEVFDLFGDDPERYGRNAPRMPRRDTCEGATPT